MRGFSSFAIVAVAACFGALIAACLPGYHCRCGKPAEIPPATLRITDSDHRPELVGADVDVKPAKVQIRTRNGLIVFIRADEPER